MSVRGFFGKLGTGVFAIGLLGVVAYFVWSRYGQRPYAAPCTYALTCRSLYCAHHEVVDGDQRASQAGMCTKSCDGDRDCGSGAACVELDDAALDDLPPLGRPERACLHARSEKSF